MKNQKEWLKTKPLHYSCKLLLRNAVRDAARSLAETLRGCGEESDDDDDSGITDASGEDDDRDVEACDRAGDRAERECEPP